MRPVGDNKRSADGRGTSVPVAFKSARRGAAGTRGLRSLATAAALSVVAAVSGGCDIKSFIDPSEMFTNTAKPIQNPILESLSDIYPSIDDPTEKFLNAQDIRPEDLLVVSSDYRIGKGDLILVTVDQLQGTGAETSKNSRVSESGNITMPLLDQVRAEGLTEAQLQKAIQQQYADQQILRNASVNVQVLEQRSRTFSALGSVGVPSEFQILKSDFRLLDAMVLFRDVPPTTSEVFVIRQVSEDPSSQSKSTGPTPPVTPSNPGVPRKPGSDPMDPRTDASPVNHPTVAQPAGPTGVAGATPAAAAAAPVPMMQAGPGSGLTFNSPTSGSPTRIIRVPIGDLRNGDLRYNIVIRPHDMIIAPLPVVGEYYMYGHVARAGVYGLTPSRVTLTQAVVATGGLDPLAIPQRTELIRRIGPNRVVMVRLDLDAIFSGTQPDIYIKPEDMVQVGTNILAPFIEDVRTGFRITYGFGFLYDRNYAPVQ